MFLILNLLLSITVKKLKIYFSDDDHVDLSLSKQKKKSIQTVNMNNSTYLRMVGMFS